MTSTIIDVILGILAVIIAPFIIKGVFEARTKRGKLLQTIFGIALVAIFLIFWGKTGRDPLQWVFCWLQPDAKSCQNVENGLKDIKEKQDALIRKVTSSLDKTDPFEKVKKISIGDKKEKIEMLLGIADTSQTNDKTNETEEFYSFEKFYLQLIYHNNRLRLLSVTTLNKDFKPSLAPFGLVAGTKTFYELMPSYDYKKNHLYSWTGARDFGYAEHYYFGFPGYHEHFIAYNGAGYDFNRETVLPMSDDEGYVLNYRKKVIPNAVGIADNADFSFFGSKLSEKPGYPDYHIGPLWTAQ